VTGGDGGYCVVNWAKPSNVLVFMNGVVYRSTTGGASQSGWHPVWDFSWRTMTQPIVCPPYDAASPGDATWVAVGSGRRVWVSNDFAANWQADFALPASSGSAVFALAFASTSRLFVGMTGGEVFRADRTDSGWSVSRIDQAAAGSLGVIGLVSDIAIDWADPTLSCIYLAFGGMGDRRHVWHFDGTRWDARSGVGQNGLLDVEHNALAVDRADPQTLFVGADIGVWRSRDSGRTWAPVQNGLPDAPVFDLQVHPTQRLLRAATHGRGVYELPLP
jgi:hypothetical protein